MSCDTVNTFRNSSNETSIIKKEVEIKIKPEPNECIVCVNRGVESYDVYTTDTTSSGTKLHDVLFRLTNVRLVESENSPKYICKSCFDLINVLEQAEIEYNKLKQTFEDIISKNPLFDLQSQGVEFNQIKNEILDDNVFEISFKDVDSEDEPLSARRKQNKNDKRKKKTLETSKRKTHDKSCWDCLSCGISGATGGKLAQTAHKLTSHLLEEGTINQQVKMEDTDRSQSPLTENNDFDSIDTAIKIALSDIDDDESSNYTPILEERRPKMKLKRSLKNKRRKNAIPKVLHQCDQCQAKYTSLLRLQSHKEKKHEDSKPPYICEMCGAKYKHKRACDIHVAMHKGISDWKCEECNKLFPSKGALQRHNNIHTGKLNYQCDMCGKSFIHLSSFKMHKLAHSGVKPHSCDVCGLALMTRSHLKRHKRVHSGEKRHECAVCGKRFSERYNLAAHARSHAAGGTPAAPPAAPRRRMFRCAYCAERFERRYMLERHCGAAHGRALERPPPTPRNTMSKLLKAQAQARRDAHTDPAPPAHIDEVDIKEDCSPKVETAPPTPHKAITSLSAASVGVALAGSWQAAPYAHAHSHAHFAPRHDYPH